MYDPIFYVHNFPCVSLYVNRCVWYIFSPKLSHQFTLKILARYLNQMKDHGLVLDPNYYICKFEAYLDAYFYGMYGNDNPADTVCVTSRTVFIITFAGFPVLWVSKL